MGLQLPCAVVMALAVAGCSLWDEGEEEGPRLHPELYEYGATYSRDGAAWIGEINIKVYDGENYQRIYYGGPEPGKVTKNVMVKGRYRIDSGHVVFRDDSIARIHLTGCDTWKDTNSVLRFPIRNIRDDGFEIFGKLELWDAPPEFAEALLSREDDWLDISDYRSPDNWPADIETCGMP